MKVFVSTSGQTLFVAQKVVQTIEKLGFSVFSYERDIRADSSSTQQVEMALHESTYVICLYSQGFMESDFCLLARDTAFIEKKLFPVMLEPVQLKGWWKVLQSLNLTAEISTNNIAGAMRKLRTEFKRFTEY